MGNNNVPLALYGTKQELHAEKQTQGEVKSKSDRLVVNTSERILQRIPVSRSLPYDKQYLKYIELVRQRIQPLPHIKDQYVALGKFVSEQMGGPISRSELGHYDAILPITLIKAQFQMNCIPIGKLRQGLMMHRALLFKALADSLLLPCTLERSSYGICWNEVMLSDKDLNVIKCVDCEKVMVPVLARLIPNPEKNEFIAQIITNLLDGDNEAEGKEKVYIYPISDEIELTCEECFKKEYRVIPYCVNCNCFYICNCRESKSVHSIEMVGFEIQDATVSSIVKPPEISIEESAQKVKKQKAGTKKADKDRKKHENKNENRNENKNENCNPKSIIRSPETKQKIEESYANNISLPFDGMLSDHMSNLQTPFPSNCVTNETSTYFTVPRKITEIFRKDLGYVPSEAIPKLINKPDAQIYAIPMDSRIMEIPLRAFVVDLMHDPGSLLSKDSFEADNYICVE
ncbi:hypothetical protein SNEBB_002573 [Seison nebaliae]|nr:hypothetical protein SNEBB_002573 [Seison nebaliae]